MRILYVSHYFPPEIGATQTRAWEAARHLASLGHQVTVLTEFPNHPSGRIPPTYRGKWLERESREDVEIIRVPVLASASKSFVRRMLFYLSFVVTGSFAGLFAARGPFDVIYVTSPPLFVGVVGLVLRIRAPMVLEIRDLWPQSAVEMGELGPGWPARMAGWLERVLYRRARHVVGVTQGIVDVLHSRIDPERVSLLPNGVNIRLYRPGKRTGTWRRKHGIPDPAFVAVYTGLHGLAHGLETLVRACESLRDDPDLVVVMIGEGPRKEALRSLAAELDLPNLRFLPPVPDEELPAILREVDLGVDCRRRLPMTSGTLPVKMFSYWACELPVVLSIDGEASDLVRECDGGDVVPPEDALAMANAIRAMRNDPERRRVAGARGRALVVERFDRAELAAGLSRILERVIGD